ncbi:hypothetical protein C0992_006220 [Termitomyces sp. T32_za158]|nr:hypothetical protein C0992_006220 [Termitomyces sp. T32_za158]
MIKTRFGETLPQAPNILQVSPFETSSRHLRHISDYASYKRLHCTLPAVVLSALKLRIKAGEPKAIQELWERKDRTFLAIDCEWSERNESSCLEWGYAAARCGHLDAMLYAKFSLSKNPFYTPSSSVKARSCQKPGFPGSYKQLSGSPPQLLVFLCLTLPNSSFASPDSEMTPNTLVLVAHGITGDLARLDDMKIKLPHNILTIDTATFERVLHSSGARGIMLDPRTNQPRANGSTLSLENALRSLPAAPHHPVTMHNAGNDAYMALYLLQALLVPTTKPPVPKTKTKARPGASGRGAGGTTPMMVPGPLAVPRPLSMSMLMDSNTPTSSPAQRTFAAGFYVLADELGAMRVEK